MIFDHLFDLLFDHGIFFLASKMRTVSLQNPEQLYDFSNTALTTLVQNYGIENGDQTDICLDSVLHVICSSKLK